MIELPPVRERGAEEFGHLSRKFIHEIVERDCVSVELSCEAMLASVKHS